MLAFQVPSKYSLKLVPKKISECVRLDFVLKSTCFRRSNSNAMHEDPNKTPFSGEKNLIFNI